MKLTDYEQKLLDGWEEVFKKGQLTMWIMLALNDGAKHMAEIKHFMHQATNGTLGVDDQSLYRALRRYHDAEMVNFVGMPGAGGAERKIYSLSSSGKKVLAAFSERNIAGVFYKPKVRSYFYDKKS